MRSMTICTARIENPHCGKFRSPFMNNRTRLLSTRCLMRSLVSALSVSGARPLVGGVGVQGERVDVATVEKIGEGRDHRGTLAGFDRITDSVMLTLESGETMAIPLGAIHRARLRRDPWGDRGGKGQKAEPRKAKRKR